MAGFSLLARIRASERNAGSRHSITEREARECVLESLRNMCTTRQGSVLTAPDYGICDVSELVHAFPDAIAMMARSIRHTIETYEPRLTEVHVRHIPSDDTDLLLRYEVSAQLSWSGVRARVKFETQLDPSKRITLK